MLSKDEIEIWIGIMEKSAKVYVEVPRVKFLELLRSELSVQEGVKDAREVAARIIDLCTFPKTEADEAMAAREIAKYASAFALKQKGEVVWEGKGCIVNGEHMTPELYVPSFRISNAGLKVDDLVHVTFSLPQQEQE